MNSNRSFFFIILVAFLILFSIEVSSKKHRIFGGQVALPGQFPFISHITPVFSNYSVSCASSIILGGNYILTAAHCVTSEDGTIASIVYASAGRLNNEIVEPTTQYAESQRIDVHPLFTHTNLTHDYALIHLKQPFVLTSAVQEIWPAEIYPIIGEPVYPIGWGLTESGNASSLLLYTTLDYLDISVCRDAYGLFVPLIDELQVCAGNVLGSDTCRGDSGGPLITSTNLNDPTTARLLGITSYGPLDCGNGLPAVFSDVPFGAVSWLKTVLPFEVCLSDCDSVLMECLAAAVLFPTDCSVAHCQCRTICYFRGPNTF